jgi:hypothetical protein
LQNCKWCREDLFAGAEVQWIGVCQKLSGGVSVSHFGPTENVVNGQFNVNA